MSYERIIIFYRKFTLWDKTENSMKIPFYKSTSCKLEFTKHVNCDRFTYCKHKFAFACKFSTFPVLCFKEKTWRSCIIWGNLGGGMGLQEYNKPYHDKLWATDCVIHFRVEIFFLRKWKILLTNFEIVTYCFHNCNLRSGDFFFFLIAGYHKCDHLYLL